jgi:hypothetical protein
MRTEVGTIHRGIDWGGLGLITLLVGCGEPSEPAGGSATEAVTQPGGLFSSAKSQLQPRSPLDIGHRTVPPEIQERALARAPLGKAAREIHEEAAKIGDSGLAGIRFDDDSVVVWWRGQLPSSVQTLIDNHRRTVKVEVRNATHSLSELRSCALPRKQQHRSCSWHNQYRSRALYVLRVHVRSCRFVERDANLVESSCRGDLCAWHPAIGFASHRRVFCYATEPSASRSGASPRAKKPAT